MNGQDQANELASAGRYEEAAEVLEDWARSLSGVASGDAWAEAARCWAAAHRLERADDAFQSAQVLLDSSDASILDRSACRSEHGVVLRRLGDDTSARRNQEIALDLRKSLPNTELLQAEVMRRIGIIERGAKRYVDAANWYRRSLDLIKKTPSSTVEVAKTRLNLGVIYRLQGKHREALREYQSALELNEGIPGTRANKARALNNIAILQRLEHDFAAAEESIRGALELYPATEKKSIATGHYNLANILRHDPGRWEECRNHYELALNAYSAIGGFMRARANILNSLGVLERELGHFEEAERNHRTAIAWLEEVGLAEANGPMLHSLATTLWTRYRSGEAISSTRDAKLREALDFAATATIEAVRMRSQFETEGDRVTWTTYRVLPRVELTFQIAAEIGDAEIVADMVTLSRAAGALALADSDRVTTGELDGVDSPAVSSLEADSDHTDEEEGPSGDTAFTAGWGAMSALGLDGLFRRQSLPSLLLPSGRRLLARVRPTDDPPIVTHR